MRYNVFQHLIRWKCNLHFQEELKGRVNFNIFSLVNSVIYGTPFYRVTHSFPSLLRDRTTGTSPNPLSLSDFYLKQQNIFFPNNLFSRFHWLLKSSSEFNWLIEIGG